MRTRYLVGAAIALALALGALTYGAVSRAHPIGWGMMGGYGYSPGMMMGGYGPGMMRGYGYGPGMMMAACGPGMMRGYGYGPGMMMGGYGPGMMRGYGYGPGMMMGGYGPGYYGGSQAQPERPDQSGSQDKQGKQ